MSSKTGLTPTDATSKKNLLIRPRTSKDQSRERLQGPDTLLHRRGSEDLRSTDTSRSQTQTQAVESRVQVKSRCASVTFSLLYRTRKKLPAQGSEQNSAIACSVRETQPCFSFFDFLALLSFFFVFSFLCFCSSVILVDAAAGVC